VTPVTWTAGVWTLLPADGASITPSGINNSGSVVGAENEGDGDYHYSAVVWSGGVEMVLPDLGTGAFSDESYALAINDQGVIVGSSVNDSGNQEAVSWTNGVITDLGGLGGPASSAVAINSSNQIVGTSSLPSTGTSHATLWSGNAITDLGTLGGASSSAMAINASGQIVGASNIVAEISDTTTAHATLWTTNGPVDLNSLISLGANITLVSAVAINDQGSIVAYDQNGFYYLLVPAN
jgi:probable HAF family extracellular repeat protein